MNKIISDKKINEEEAWQAVAPKFLGYAYRFLENTLPKELLANPDLKEVKLRFWNDDLRPGSIYYKPDTNQIIVPPGVKINEINDEGKSRLISLFVHELMHAVFQNYLNKEKSENGKYITSDSSIALLAEGISYIFENLYLLYGDKFILNKDEIIDGIKKKIQDEKRKINMQKLDKRPPFKGSPAFNILRDAWFETEEALSKATEVLKSLGISIYPSSKEQLLAADLLLNKYKESKFDTIGEFILVVIKNHKQEAKNLANMVRPARE